MTDRELQHQKIYLEMYRKGQESARFEREEEVSDNKMLKCDSVVKGFVIVKTSRLIRCRTCFRKVRCRRPVFRPSVFPSTINVDPSI